MKSFKYLLLYIKQCNITQLILSYSFILPNNCNSDHTCRFSSSPLFKEDGFFFIRHHGRYIATAFAWQEEFHTPEGILHWLAVLPEYQRCGLGRALALCILKYHKEHGKASVSLTTEVYRDVAIKLYKDIGFVLCDTGGNGS